jgi:hypothetical protein
MCNTDDVCHVEKLLKIFPMSIILTSFFSTQVIIGHTEDACPEFLNNVYIVSAEILGDQGEKLEKFTTLTYAGHLPGYTMGYNEHGLVYTVNTLFPKENLPGKTRTFCLIVPQIINCILFFVIGN